MCVHYIEAAPQCIDTYADVVSRTTNSSDESIQEPVEIDGKPIGMFIPRGFLESQGALSNLFSLLRDGVSAEVIPTELLGEIWQILGVGVEAPVVWARPAGFHRSSFRSICSDVLNSVGGSLIEAMVHTTAWTYNALAKEQGVDVMSNIPIEGVESRLAPILNRILANSGESLPIVHSALGRYLPQLSLYAPSWLAENLERLIGQGLSDPVHSPFWMSYLVHAPLYNECFKLLRDWYGRTADAIAELQISDVMEPTNEIDESMTQTLTVDVLRAAIQGWANVGDSDRLIEKTFESVPVADRAHSYWNVFRAWSDTEIPIPGDLIQRLFAFWEWRLSILGDAVPNDSVRHEAEGLRWFLNIPALPPEETISLGRRTLRLGTDRNHPSGLEWKRLEALSDVDAAGTLDLAELLIQEQFQADFIHLPFEEVSPPLRAALKVQDPEVKRRARRLINQMGERGLVEFGELLTDLDPGAE